jgi:hypothetical protein
MSTSQEERGPRAPWAQGGRRKVHNMLNDHDRREPLHVRARAAVLEMIKDDATPALDDLRQTVIRRWRADINSMRLESVRSALGICGYADDFSIDPSDLPPVLQPHAVEDAVATVDACPDIEYRFAFWAQHATSAYPIRRWGVGRAVAIRRLSHWITPRVDAAAFRALDLGSYDRADDALLWNHRHGESDASGPARARATASAER